ncbi:MAG: response regulator [Chloroflexi bacterium]|nr:response regulator [Chloroflexota bacterium]
MGEDSVRVLIVEDDPACTDLYTWYLRGDPDIPYATTVVDTGARALAIIERAPPQCAILDFHLPDTTGLEVLSRLTGEDGTIPFAVIMVSAMASTELATAALSAGALDCLDKTKVTEPGLRRAVRTALERNRLRRQVEAQRQAVAEQARRISQILERVTDGFFALDRSWRFTFVNPIAEETFGRDGRSLLGQRLPDLYPELATSDLARELARASDQGITTSLETFYEPTRRWLEVHAYPDADGVSVYFHDVTDRKEAEAERERQFLRGQSLLRVVRDFAAEGDPQRLVGSIAEEAMRLLDGDRVLIARWDEQAQTLMPLATQTGASEGSSVGGAGSAITLAVERRRPVVVNYDVPPSDADLPEGTVAAEVAAPLVDEDRILGAISVTVEQGGRRFGLEDADLLEVLAGLAAATLVGHEEARLDGVLLSARTAQHEVNNRLSLVRGYAEMVADHPDLPDDLRKPADEILRGSRAAADILRRLGKLDTVRAVEWGPGLRPTLDLSAPGE